jgi:hypothetical protein
MLKHRHPPELLVVITSHRLLFHTITPSTSYTDQNFVNVVSKHTVLNIGSHDKCAFPGHILFEIGKPAPPKLRYLRGLRVHHIRFLSEGPPRAMRERRTEVAVGQRQWQSRVYPDTVRSMGDKRILFIRLSLIPLTSESVHGKAWTIVEQSPKSTNCSSPTQNSA